MVKTVLAGVNIVEYGLFSYSPDRIIPIKPSLYGVYVSSFVPYPVREFLCWFKIISLGRGVAGGSWGARDPPLVGLLLRKQPTIFTWRKRHDNILAVGILAIVEKPTFLKFVFFVKCFRQRLLSLVNIGLYAPIIRLSPLIHEGEQRYKSYIVGDSRMVTPPPAPAPLWKILATPLLGSCWGICKKILTDRTLRTG